MIYFGFHLFYIRYKLIDFDISERVPPTGYLCDAAGVTIGTDGFIAPERLSSKPYWYPVDIWALGCTIYYLCTRRLPYPDGYKADIHPEPIMGYGYSTELASLVGRMLDPNPSTRITAKQILTHPSVESCRLQLGIPVTSLALPLPQQQQPQPQPFSPPYSPSIPGTHSFPPRNHLPPQVFRQPHSHSISSPLLTQRGGGFTNPLNPPSLPQPSPPIQTPMHKEFNPRQQVSGQPISLIPQTADGFMMKAHNQPSLPQQYPPQQSPVQHSPSQDHQPQPSLSTPSLPKQSPVQPSPPAPALPSGYTLIKTISMGCSSTSCVYLCRHSGEEVCMKEIHNPQFGYSIYFNFLLSLSFLFLHHFFPLFFPELLLPTIKISVPSFS